MTPRHPSSPLATPLQLETEPPWLGFRFLTQSPSLPRVSQTHNPVTTTTWYMPLCHSHAPSSVAFPHGAPQIEPQLLGFGFRPSPPPHLTFCKHTAPHPPPPGMCHHATPTHCPPLLSHIVRPKLSHNGPVSVGFFLAQTPVLPH